MLIVDRSGAATSAVLRWIHHTPRIHISIIYFCHHKTDQQKPQKNTHTHTPRVNTTGMQVCTHSAHRALRTVKNKPHTPHTDPPINTCSLWASYQVHIELYDDVYLLLEVFISYAFVYLFTFCLRAPNNPIANMYRCAATTHFRCWLDTFFFSHPKQLQYAPPPVQ